MLVTARRCPPLLEEGGEVEQYHTADDHDTDDGPDKIEPFFVLFFPEK